jgi:hypothetical protein
MLCQNFKEIENESSNEKNIGVRVTAFNVTLNNISVISLRSVLLVGRNRSSRNLLHPGRFCYMSDCGMIDWCLTPTLAVFQTVV